MSSKAINLHTMALDMYRTISYTAPNDHLGLIWCRSVYIMILEKRMLLCRSHCAMCADIDDLLAIKGMERGKQAAARSDDLCQDSSATRPAQNHTGALDTVSLLFKADTLNCLARDIQSTILRKKSFEDLDGVHVLWMFPGECVLNCDNTIERGLAKWESLADVLRKYDVREWSFFYQVNFAELRWKAKPTRGASMPRQDNTTALFPHALPDSILMTVVRFVGAHNLETFWPCKDCNPYWMYWRCKHCRLENFYVEWTSISHFGRCGRKCLCCRSAKLNRRVVDLASLGCRACEHLLQLGRTCHMMRKLIKAYNGI